MPGTRLKAGQRKPKLQGRAIQDELSLIIDMGTLLDLRMELKATSGIYFLFEGEEIIYIGQSADVTRRLIQHRDRGGIKFGLFVK